MITIPPQESLHHLSSYIGQSMQIYRMFENLLGLRASEIKIVKTQQADNDSSDDDIEARDNKNRSKQP